MAKKRLVDLLREEAHKAPEAENETVQRRQETVEQAPDLEIEAVQENLSDHELETDATTSSPALARSRRTGPTKAELEITVAELREVVQEAQRKEAYLQQQSEDLQSALEEQKTLVAKLQAELDQAKKVILQLSDTNAKTTQEKAPKSSQKIALRKAPHHTIQPNSSPDMFSNKGGIGWAD